MAFPCAALYFLWSSSGIVAIVEGFDCLACGACCYGPEDYVDLLPSDLSNLSARSLARYTVRRGPRRALRMVQGHCAALKSRQGHFSCRLYSQRPRACRVVERGSLECLDARRRQNVNPH